MEGCTLRYTTVVGIGKRVLVEAKVGNYGEPIVEYFCDESLTSDEAGAVMLEGTEKLNASIQSKLLLG